MRKARIDGQQTRQALLESASEIFAERGFRQATIARICRKAKVNIAAANYHFGNKETLYVESWRFALDRSLRLYPPEGGVPAQSPVEERLRGRILAIMRRILDPRSHELDIVYKEMANPTGLLAGVVKQGLEPVFGGLISIIGELLGPLADEQQILLCLMSIRAQCFGPLMRERRSRLVAGGPPPLMQERGLEDVDAVADHVTRFSLAGIRAVRSHLENRNHAEKPAPRRSARNTVRSRKESTEGLV